MGYIILNSVTFDRVVAQSKQATVKYKLATEPDSSFITKTAIADIIATSPASTTGNFSPSVIIDGLINGESYTVETTLNCSGLGVRFTTSAGTVQPTSYAVTGSQGPTELDACSGTIQTYYCDMSSPQDGAHIYYDAAMVNPLSDPFFKDSGGTVWAVGANGSLTNTGSSC